MVESNINKFKKRKSMVRQINEGIMGVNQDDYDDKGFFDPNKQAARRSGSANSGKLELKW